MRVWGLRAGLMAALTGLVAVSFSVTPAQASTVPARSAATSAAVRPMTAATSICTDASLGGAFYCDSTTSGEAWYQFPNGLWQLFVVGTNNAVWTRWEESNGSYHAWYSMGGYSSSYPVVLNGSGYSPQINVIGRDGSYWWYRVRSSSGGSWSAWACCA